MIIEQTLQQQCKEVEQTEYEEQCSTLTEEKCSMVTEYKCKQPQLGSPVDPLTYNPYEVNQVFTDDLLTQRQVETQHKMTSVIRMNCFRLRFAQHLTLALLIQQQKFLKEQTH